MPDGQVVFEITGNKKPIEQVLKETTSSIEKETKNWDKAADMYGDLSNVYIDTSFGLRSLKPGERGYYTQEALGLMEAETFMKLVRDLEHLHRHYAKKPEKL